jgi:ATP-binding cassette subfamily F protein uup
MSALIGIHSLSKSYGTQQLFDGISFTLHEGARIGLIGPNGAGKSTLIKILMGQETPDTGSVTKRQGLRLGYASQFPEFDALPIINILLAQPAPGDEIERVTRAKILLQKAEFLDFNQNAHELSGGWKKRLDLIRTLMIEPDLLLLDEPTNHLDLEGILWLERFLQRERISYIVVSHDRYFLDQITTTTMELNRCFPQGIFVADGSFSDFLMRKNAFLEAEHQKERGIASVLRKETEWLRRSPKARTTKSYARIQQAYELRDALSDLQERNKVKKADISFTASERETRKLLVAKNLTKSLGDKLLFKGIDLTLSPGSRIGLVGRNGSGKTTLLRILSKMVPQDLGTIKYADDLRIVYFDQHREQIPKETTLRRALAPNSDTVNYQGIFIHVNGWAERFLFSKERMELPVGCLSGGERARILIAKLMLEPADILFLDEPTNDLDIQTLEVIEESLKDFPGAVVLISHDRCLMERVCTQILSLGDSKEQEMFACYSQWEESVKSKKPTYQDESRKAPSKVSNPLKQKKISYQEQKEWEGMEIRILETEETIRSLHEKMQDSSFNSDCLKSKELYHQLAEAEEQLEHLFDRWQSLENLMKTLKT